MNFYGSSPALSAVPSERVSLSVYVYIYIYICIYIYTASAVYLQPANEVL